MSKSRRSFSASEKLSTTNEVDQFAINATLRKRNLSPTLFRRGRGSFNDGVALPVVKAYTKQLNPEVEAMEEQIWVLKNIAAK